MTPTQKQILAVLDDAICCPREDILWECSVALLNIIQKHPSGLRELCGIDFACNYASRIVALRSLGYMYGNNDLRLEMITGALSNSDAAVRDAAISALVSLADTKAVPYLRDLLVQETDPGIREAITDAIQEFT